MTELQINTLIITALATALLVWVILGPITQTVEKQKPVLIETHKARITACKLEGMYGSYMDNDNDRHPDDCDVCLGASDEADDDKDGVPNGCDKEPNKPANKKIEAKLACAGKGIWDSNLRSCVLGEYYKKEPKLYSAMA